MIIIDPHTTAFKEHWFCDEAMSRSQFNRPKNIANYIYQQVEK